MSGDGWGSSFGCIAPKTEAGTTQPSGTAINAIWKNAQAIADIERVTGINTIHLYNKKERCNVPPTHDPYTNPDAQLYYSCNCGAVLDPGTKRFAELNNCASKAGWKIRFTDTGYVPYCVDCGKGVE